MQASLMGMASFLSSSSACAMTSSSVAAKIDSDATDDEVIAQAEDELRKLAMPIKEACMTPAVKRSLYRHVAMLLDLRK